MSTISESVCVICRTDLVDQSPDWIQLTAKGIETLLHFCDLRNDEVLRDYLFQKPTVVKAHIDCRKKYTNKRRYEQEQQLSSSRCYSPACKALRSASEAFDWKRNCFLCCQSAANDNRHPDRIKVVSVQTLELQKKLMEVCSTRNDSWSQEVEGRLNACCDLCAEEAVYHKECYSLFVKRRHQPSVGGEATSIASDVRGRPIDEDMQENFDKLCEWLEDSDDELCSLDELHARLESIASSSDSAYSTKQLKRKLVDRYGDHIFFSNVHGKKNVVCFRNMASLILTEKWYSEKNSNLEDESLRIVLAAAKLIKAKIKETTYSTEKYPNSEEFSSVSNAKQWVPELLLAFVDNIVHHDTKQAAISHCIVQAVRPRSVIAPILFNLAVSLDNKFGSEWLANTLAHLGFSLSYDEITRFKHSVAQSDKDVLPQSYPESFTQWSGDNVDHSLKTLHGTGGFHGMGIISMSVSNSGTGSVQGHFSEKAVIRLKRQKVESIHVNRGVPLVTYHTADTAVLASVQFKPFDELKVDMSESFANIDLLWHVGWFFSRPEQPRPSWAGFMHDVTRATSDFPPSADVRLLPIIDLNPNDMSCVYSTLLFVECQAQQLGMPTACITFDQPLWQKAVEIVLSKNLNVVCRLGGFHTLMNFLGAVGSIMAGSGLSEALQTCYGPVTVTHMLTGKAYSKALRGHFLVESALTILLFRRFLIDGTAEDDTEGTEVLNLDDVQDLEQLYRAVTNDTDQDNDEALQSCLDKLTELKIKLDEFKHELAARSRTAKLWIQYLYYISVAKDFIRGERTGNWQLHLESLSRMLKLFAASGHVNYAKCGRLYLQLMLDLQQTHPWLHERFSTGCCHSVRRSNRFWAAISTDLMIEQVMMRGIKSQGGLTHGRGLTDSVRMIWVRSLHKCAEIYFALNKLTNLEDSSDDAQHVELSRSRMQNDYKDLLQMIRWFKVNNAFAVSDFRLHNLFSGITARDEDGINCDDAESVGEGIMQRMDNGVLTEFVIRKAYRAKTLADISVKLRIGDKRVPIDSTILFSRLLVIVQRSPDIQSCFQHELTALPTAFFKGTVMRKANKSLLGKELKAKTDNSYRSDMSTVFVIDGGWLLHKVKWQSGGTYADVVHQYVQYVKHHFGHRVTAVFDGYSNGPTIKDHEHDRRSLTSAPNIAVDATKPVFANQATFLANEGNKKSFIDLLANQLRAVGHNIYQAPDDADTLIVSKALEIARKNESVTVVATDTDVLVLLLYHFEDSMEDIFFHSEVKLQKLMQTQLSSIRGIKDSLGDETCRQLLVAHAIGGCDSTSALYGRGKVNVFRKIAQNGATLGLTDTLLSCSSSHKEVEEATLKLLALIYGGGLNDSLNRMRYVAYMNMITSGTTQLRPERLPPTANAARYHGYRVHVQVLQWKTLMNTFIKPEEWGWSIVDGRYVPFPTDLDAAPQDMLSVIRCKCKTTTPRPCSTQQCSCVKHGLPCVAACKNCNGQECDNGEVTHYCSDTDDDEAEDRILTLNDDIPMLDDELELDLPWASEEIVEREQAAFSHTVRRDSDKTK